MASPSPSSESKFFGYRDLAFLAANTVTGLFPLDRSSPEPALDDEQDGASDDARTEGHREEDPLEGLAEFTAYVLYRTILPRSHVFHALHLLLRLSASDAPLPEVFDAVPSPDSDGPAPRNIMHYRLLLAALILCTAYSMDDAYSNRSWAIAARFLFPRDQIDALELGLLGALGWQLTADDEKLDELVAAYEADFDASLAEREEAALEQAETARLHELEARRREKLVALMGPEIVAAHLGHPADDGQDARRRAKMKRILGDEAGLLYPAAGSPTQFAFVVDVPSDEIAPLSLDADEGERAAAAASPAPKPARAASRPPPTTPLHARKRLRKRTISGSSRPVTPAGRQHVRQAPSLPWAGKHPHPTPPSAAAVARVNAVGTPAAPPATALESCQCALEREKALKRVAAAKSAEALFAAAAAVHAPCKWCLVERAKAKLSSRASTGTMPPKPMKASAAHAARPKTVTVAA